MKELDKGQEQKKLQANDNFITEEEAEKDKLIEQLTHEKVISSIH